MRRTVNAAHRWVGLILAVPLLVWAGTGLLFHIKPGWAEAYEPLSSSTGAPLEGRLVAPATICEGGDGPGATRVEYLDTILGPIARVHRSQRTSLHDAITGTQISPIEPGAGRNVVADAVSRSANRERYGQLAATDLREDELSFSYKGGVTVTLDRNSLAIRQRGTDTDLIDWLYRLHYLQWTGVAGLDRVLGVLGVVAIWVLAGLGVALAFRRRRTFVASRGGAA